MNASDYTSLTARLVAHGVDLKSGPERSFGAQGHAVRSVYFRDPDGNVLHAWGEPGSRPLWPRYVQTVSADANG